MKQGKIIKAYMAINKLYEQKLPLSVSHKLWMLRQKLTPTWDFQVDKEHEVILKYDPNISVDGNVTFKSDADSKACREEYNKVCAELENIDVDLGDFKKVTIHLDDKIELSLGDIEALDEFVDFVE